MEIDNFREKVLENCKCECENPLCNNNADTVHHFHKRSIYPEHATNIINGMGCCSSCHVEIEKRLRCNENFEVMYPLSRYVVSIIELLGRSYWIEINVKKDGNKWIGIDRNGRNVSIIYNLGSAILYIYNQKVLEVFTYTQSNFITEREVFMALINKGVCINLGGGSLDS